MFSLYPTKNMTSGEGGMVSCATDEIARNVRLLRNQGMERQYANEVVGFNARMTDIHAAIGRVQLTKVGAWTEARRANAAFLDQHLEGVVVPPVADEATHVYHQYTIRVPGGERDRVVAALREEHQVGCGVYYPIPNHQLESLRHFAPDLELPVTAQAAAEVISLPVHPSLTEGDLERIVAGRQHRRRSGWLTPWSPPARPPRTGPATRPTVQPRTVDAPVTRSSSARSAGRRPPLPARRGDPAGRGRVRPLPAGLRSCASRPTTTRCRSSTSTRTSTPSSRCTTAPSPTGAPSTDRR